MSETIERHEFGAEVGRLLDLVVHALYSDREIFLRELVANAADAMDRRRFEALTSESSALPPDAKVRIAPDKEARTLTISDAGIGMAKDDLASSLGTIARSGTRAFSQTLESAKAEDRPSLIGQFGVGFYSAFMVADRVTVTSRKVGSDEAWTWASEGQGSYTLEPGARAEPGTDIVLHIKEDADEYLEPYRLDHLVRKWADFITVPVAIVRDGKDEAANQGTALWRKSKSEITEEQYTEFYHALGMNFDKPWATLHWRAEGQLEFSACSSCRARSRSSRSRTSARARCASMSGACSSPMKPSCCRPGCASYRVWSTPRICPSTCPARCCNRPRHSPASARR